MGPLGPWGPGPWRLPVGSRHSLHLGDPGVSPHSHVLSLGMRGFAFFLLPGGLVPELGLGPWPGLGSEPGVGPGPGLNPAGTAGAIWDWLRP